jgi:hypothetical protein
LGATPTADLRLWEGLLGAFDATLNRASTGHEINDQNDHRYYEQEMYEAPTDVR